MRITDRRHGKIYLLSGVVFLLLLTAWISFASDLFCASVKIEIAQELTLERQAFDAHMRINNGLSGISLENVDIDVTFTDEEGNTILASSDPENESALFFIKIDSMDNISNVDGSGAVASSSSADIHWMIIPAQGASNGLEAGTQYNVGATLKYTIGGEEKVTEVSPDFIFVKPMPNLVLDYFLPSDVYGDDPATEPIEEIVPFSLGVRVTNSGHGTAKNLKIDSAQPKIVENEQGLLIGFILEGSQVEGQEEQQSLLVDFGDIPSNEAKMARWKMTCSLAGRFVEFKADYSHSDELGGELTSLIESVNTHVLIREVVADLPGRDQTWDYLAKDGDIYRVYESNSTTTEVTNQSSSSTIQSIGQNGTEAKYAVTAPSTAGFMYLQLTDPNAGSKILKRVTRSDGKIIRSENAWLSKTKDSDKNWIYFVHIFDVDTTGHYTLVFEDAASMPQPPNIQFIPDRTGVEGQQISFIVEASDPNGETPVISASPLPVGAILTDQRNGKAIFDWTPSIGQAGQYPITFRATDGVHEGSRKATITINSIGDSDGDGLPDAWEMSYFGNLDRNGTGDYDGDGISDMAEFLMGLNPSYKEAVPGIPVIVSPEKGASTATLNPPLTIRNSTNPSGASISYEYQLYSDREFNHQIVETQTVPEGQVTTTWDVPLQLADNSHYYWRVRAITGEVKTQWAYGDFFVNTVNDPPGSFHISSPSAGMKVDTLTPLLQVNNSRDADGNQVTYRFDVFSDSGLTTPVASSGEINQGEGGATQWIVSENSLSVLQEGVIYYWRVEAKDTHGDITESNTGSFSIDLSNTAPWAPTLLSPLSSSIINSSEPDLSITESFDSNGDTLTYHVEMDMTDTFNSPTIVASDSGSSSWHVEGLSDNTRYFWRAKAFDGMSESLWSVGQFFVSLVNEEPQIPMVKNPGQTSWVTDKEITLSVHSSKDPENDPVTYSFEIYSDADLSTLVAEATETGPEWKIPSELENNKRYYWRSLSLDTHGAASDWSETSSFFLKKSEIPETIRVSVTTSSGIPIAETAVSAFKEDGTSAGRTSTTDASGVASFNPTDFSQGSYKFRVTYMGRQYWTGTSAIPGTYDFAILIEDKEVNLTIATAGGAVPGVRVYVFTETGAYLGVYHVTDENGQITMALPVGSSFKFRADMYGNQYWSDVCAVSANTSNIFTVQTGGGLFTINLQEKADSPMEGVKLYLFKNSGTYLNHYETTDAAGMVGFDVSEGVYKVRADYLGYQFWSPDTTVARDTIFDMTIPHEDTAVTLIAVFEDTASSVEGVNVYLFTETGSYVNVRGTTDENGQVLFRIPEKTYKVRADYMGSQFWSEPFAWDDITLEIPMADATVKVGRSGMGYEGVKVYAFSAVGQYLNLNGTTDENGQTVFRLPADKSYRFRADYQSNQYWSAEVALVADQDNPVDISTGGGAVTFTIGKEDNTPIEGVKSYVFNENGTYINESGTTNSEGAVSFDLASGNYKIRADYLGYQFWSQIYSVTNTLVEFFSILHGDVVIAVSGVYGVTRQPVMGIPVYLFTPGGSYINVNGTTDNSGTVVFNLPGKAYKVRADYMGKQFWSDEFTSENSSLDIPMAESGITVISNGVPVKDVKVYVFSQTNTYLNLNAVTDANGNAVFMLASGSYRFRADYMGKQFWSDAVELPAHQQTPVVIDTGGGVFTLTLKKDSVTPLNNVRCYVFNDKNAYLGQYGNTDASGHVSFTLADGSYKFRIDHMGYQFWTSIHTIPGSLSDTFIINYNDVAVRVEGTYQTPEPISGARVYLFSESGSYMNINSSTNSDGESLFSIPEKNYKARIDYLGYQFWSDIFSMTDTTVTISKGVAEIHVQKDGANVQGAIVYLFTESGVYQSWSKTTDASGVVSFEIPGRSYKFRIDKNGTQTWTTPVTVAAGEITTLNVTM